MHVTDDFVRHAALFISALRAAGLMVPVTGAASFLDALVALDPATGAGVASVVDPYWAGRITLVRRPEDVPIYDRIYHRFWIEEDPALLAGASGDVLGEDDDDQAPDAPQDDECGVVRWSAREALRVQDFALCSDSEIEEAYRLMRDLRLVGAQRRTRRLRRSSSARRGRPDLRRMVRGSLRSGGELVPGAFRERSLKARRVVLLCDVSGSMEPYLRPMLRFFHVSVVARRDIEAFALGTRVTRITRELSSHDPDAALAKASRAVPDWAGGTRLGDGLRQFNDRWGFRGLARGAVVVIISDGWDQGDPQVLEAEMARLKRVAHRVIWVNPLKASPSYEPLTSGMRAALPHVDVFLEGHSFDSLDALAKVIAR